MCVALTRQLFYSQRAAPAQPRAVMGPAPPPPPAAPVGACDASAAIGDGGGRKRPHGGSPTAARARAKAVARGLLRQREWKGLLSQTLTSELGSDTAALARVQRTDAYTRLLAAVVKELRARGESVGNGEG